MSKLTEKELARLKRDLREVASHPVVTAVMPMHIDALAKAEEWAKLKVEVLKEKLAAHNWDREAYAPYPDSWKMSRAEYRQKANLYNFVRSMTTGLQASRHRGEADPCVINEEAVAKFIEECRELAGAQYDSFCVKLAHKVGECTNACVDGSHVWSFSILTTNKMVDGELVIQRWKTQQITNVSVLGNYFPQWPTRLMKEKTK